MRRPATWRIPFCGMAGLAVAQHHGPPEVLPATAVERLKASLLASRPHAAHLWRDTAPVLANGLTAAYVEIARGHRRLSGQLRLRSADGRVGRRSLRCARARAVDRRRHRRRRTDRRAVPDGRREGHDAKAVLSRVDAAGRPLHALDAEARERIARFFAIYKRHDPGARSVVRGWDDAVAGARHVELTHAFFARCSRVPVGDACVPSR